MCESRQIMERKAHMAAVCTALLALCACSVAPPGADVWDPYETQNRAIHAFNKDVDSALLRPLGAAVSSLPEGTADPVVNFAANAALPGMVLNGLLQGDIDSAASNLVRFLVNTVVGIGGLADVSSELGLYAQERDFGQTLAVWGVPEGAYVELPLLGPSTERDAVGELVDLVLDPLQLIHGGLMPRQIGWMQDYGTAAWAADQVISRGRYGDTVDSLLYESADSYAQARLLYLQNRRFELAGDGAAAADPFADDALALEIFGTQE